MAAANIEMTIRNQIPEVSIGSFDCFLSPDLIDWLISIIKRKKNQKDNIFGCFII